MAQVIIPPTWQEISFRQCQRLLMVNPLAMNTYYTTLFNAFHSLLQDEDNQQLDEMIKHVEEWLSDDLNQMKLFEIEMRMYNNMDLLSGFQVNNVLITQMEINEKLEEIKGWLTQKLYEYLPYIRFTSQVDL